MSIQNKKWYIVSRIFGGAAVFMVGVLLMDAFVLGDAGPDRIWYVNACITGLFFGLGVFAENKAGVTYKKENPLACDEDEEDDTAPAFLLRMWGK